MKYFVEYIDNGVECSDVWSQECLDHEMELGEVTITHIELAYDLQKQLGLVSD